MRRSMVALVIAAAGVIIAEAVLGVHGHWPIAFSAALGLAGCLLLVLSAQVFAAAGLQLPDTDEDEGSGT